MLSCLFLLLLLLLLMLLALLLFLLVVFSSVSLVVSLCRLPCRSSFLPLSSLSVRRRSLVCVGVNAFVVVDVVVEPWSA